MNIDDMEGTALDVLVAEKIFGLVPCTGKSHEDGRADWPCYSSPSHPSDGGGLHPYSGYMPDAMNVVDELLKKGFILTLVGTARSWEAAFVRSETVHFRGQGKTAELAICRAAVKAADVLKAVSRG